MFYVLVFMSLMTLQSVFQEGKLEVIPTKDPDVFHIIYKGDMKWNVELTLFNEKGRKRLEQEIVDSDGFILPISLKNEKSGTYVVEVFTPVYNLRKEFRYVNQMDKLAGLLEVRFNRESRTITLSSEELVDAAFNVFILNEKGDQLVSDDVQPFGGKITRIYNLKGAPALRLQFVVMASGSEIIRKTFD